MRIFLECEFEVVGLHEHDNGTVSFDYLTFLGCTQNVSQFMSVSEVDAAQQEIENEVEKRLSDRANKIIERREMACDNFREIQRECQAEALAERAAQRGSRV